jgi:multiple sugar transport system permease protein
MFAILEKRHSRAFRRAASLAATYLLLLCASAFFVVPYLLALLASLKQPNQIFDGSPFALPHPATFANFTQLFRQYHFGIFILNTAIVAFAIAIGQVIFCAMAAYAFARMQFPGRDVLFYIFLATLLVPGSVTVIPIFLIAKELHLLNSLLGLIIPYVGSSTFGVFLIRQFFLRIPEDLISAAKLDGANSARILLKIIIPLSRPVLFTLGILSFVFGWNNFLWPLIATNSQGTQVLTVGLAALQGSYGGQWNLLITGGVISLVPLVILFFVFQRFILSSIQLTSFR